MPLWHGLSDNKTKWFPLGFRVQQWLEENNFSACSCLHTRREFQVSWDCNCWFFNKKRRVQLEHNNESGPWDKLNLMFCSVIFTALPFHTLHNFPMFSHNLSLLCYNKTKISFHPVCFVEWSSLLIWSWVLDKFQSFPGRGWMINILRS